MAATEMTAKFSNQRLNYATFRETFNTQTQRRPMRRSQIEPYPDNQVFLRRSPTPIPAKAMPSRPRLAGSGTGTGLFAEKVPDTDDVNEPKEPPTMEAGGATPANENDTPRPKPNVVIAAGSEVKVTNSDGCDALNVSALPAPNIASVKVPDKQFSETPQDALVIEKLPLNSCSTFPAMIVAAPTLTAPRSNVAENGATIPESISVMVTATPVAVIVVDPDPLLVPVTVDPAPL